MILIQVLIQWCQSGPRNYMGDIWNVDLDINKKIQAIQWLKISNEEQVFWDISPNLEYNQLINSDPWTHACIRCWGDFSMYLNTDIFKLYTLILQLKTCFWPFLLRKGENWWQQRRKLYSLAFLREIWWWISFFFHNWSRIPFSDQSIWGEKVVTGPQGGQIPCKGGSILDTKETNAGGIQTKKDCK